MRAQPRRRSAEGEVDELDVMNRDVGSGIAADDPFGELLAADRLRFEQGAIAVVDVTQDAVYDMGAQLFMIRVGQLMVHDLGEYAAAARECVKFVQFL